MPYLFVICGSFKTSGLSYFSRYLFLIFLFLQTGIVYAVIPSDTLFIVSGISVTGNKVSKESVILKELTFKMGDSLSRKQITEGSEKSRENLLNTSLFNFVIINYTFLDNSEISFFISIIERWYIWPSPIFEHAERNLGAFIHDPNWKRINYGGQIFWDNFRGRREQVKVKIRLGYKEQYEISYVKPNFGKKQQHGVDFTINSTRQHEVNLYSLNNKPEYIWNENSYLLEVFNPYFFYSYRSSLYSWHNLSLSYSGITYRDSGTHEKFTGLPVGKNPEWFLAEYIYQYDFRDSKVYPLNGYYFRINIRRRESLLPGKEGFSKSSVLFNGTHHGMLYKGLYYNQALRLQLAKDTYEPKVYRTGLGYGPYLRGYELFVMDGNTYGLLITNLKYCLMRERTYNLAYIPWSQFNPMHLSFYANLFFDMAYVQGKYYDDAGNNYVNRYLYTGGLGIDMVSYYDQVIRFEISMNREGRAGFFIHAEVPFSRW
jgi:outer membrane protein assembly factor BamA